MDILVFDKVEMNRIQTLPLLTEREPVLAQCFGVASLALFG